MIKKVIEKVDKFALTDITYINKSIEGARFFPDKLNWFRENMLAVRKRTKYMVYVLSVFPHTYKFFEEIIKDKSIEEETESLIRLYTLVLPQYVSDVFDEHYQAFINLAFVDNSDRLRKFNLKASREEQRKLLTYLLLHLHHTCLKRMHFILYATYQYYEKTESKKRQAKKVKDVVSFIATVAIAYRKLKEKHYTELKEIAKKNKVRGFDLEL